MSEGIPLSVPYLGKGEIKAVKECVSGGWVSTAGPAIGFFEKSVAEFTGAKHIVACNSGTSALHVSLLVCGIKPNDEVIVPTVTFIAPINAVNYCQAKPVFMDCDKFYNLDVVKTIDFIERETIFRNGFTFNKKSKRRISCLIPVHVFGNAVDLEVLIVLCRQRNIKVVEDATESLGTFYLKGLLKSRHTGVVGDVGTLSFNGNKIITAGSGGMIMTNRSVWAKEANYLTTQAKDDTLYYKHDRVGYNYRMNNLQASLGLAQLGELKKIISIKQKNYLRYKNKISQISGLDLVDVPSFAENNYWMYALRVDQKVYGRNRDELLKLFYKENIQVRPLWQLNHRQKPYIRCQRYKIKQANMMYEQTINIPCSAGLKQNQINKVIRLLRLWKK